MNDVLNMAKCLEMAACAFVGCIILRQHNDDNMNVYTTICHRSADRSGIDSSSTFQDLTYHKYTDGPEMPSQEFFLKEGEKIRLSTQGNLRFDSDQLEHQCLIFHSNLKRCLETRVTHRDEFAQHGREEYSGKIACSRNSESEQQSENNLCIFTLTIPKVVRHI